MHSEKGYVEEKVMLDAIRTDFVSDGLSWANISEERKMVHLWRKLKRTEEALRAAHQETQLIKQQRKEEMIGIEDFISNIRSLSQQKDVLTRQLETDNDNLRNQLRDHSAEREALISENNIVASLLALEGLRPNGTTSNQLKLLLEERKEWQVKMKVLDQEKVALAEELERLKTVLEMEKTALHKDVTKLSDQLDKQAVELGSTYKMNASLQQEVKSLRQRLEDEKLELSSNIEGLKRASELMQCNYEKQVKQLENENAVGKRTLLNCKSALKKSETEKTEMRGLIEQLRVELSQQKQKVKLDVDKQRKKLQDKLTRTEGSNEELKSRMSLLEKEYEDKLKKKMEEVASSSQACINDIKASLEESRQSQRNAEGEILTLKQQLNEEKANFAALLTSSQLMEGEKLNLEVQLGAMTKNNDEEKLLHRQDALMYEEQHAKLKQQIMDLTSELEGLKGKVISQQEALEYSLSVSKERDELNQEVKKMAEENRMVCKVRDELESEIKKMAEENQSMSKKIEELHLKSEVEHIDMKQQLNICQETSAEEKSKLQEEMEALKQQLATVQLGVQQQKATSDSLMDSLQRKEEVLSEERQQNVKVLEEMGRKDELIKTLNDQLQTAGICQEASAEEKSKLQEEIEALKQQLATVQLGAQQQKATSDSLMDSLQKKEEVLSEERQQNVKVLEEMGRKDELIKTLNAQLQSAGICQEASMEALKQQLATVQLGAQQQKATSDSLMDSLQRKEEVLSEERQQNVKLLEEMGRKDELIKTLNDQLQTAGICQEASVEEKSMLQEEMEALKQQLATVQLGAQQQKATSDSLMDSLQRKEEVLSEERQQNVKLLEEMGRKDELIKTLNDQLQNAGICQEASMDALKQQLATVQLGAQQQKATSDSLLDSLQRKEEVLSEERQQNVKLLEEMGRKDELIKTLNDQLQTAGICQEASVEEKSKLQEEMEALKQQLATVQLGVQQQKATSDSLMDSLQRKEEVLSEERQQNVKVLEEMGRKDELIKTLNDQLHSTRQEEEEEKVKLTKQLEGLQSSYDSVLELMKAKDLKLEAALSSGIEAEAKVKHSADTIDQMERSYARVKKALDKKTSKNEELNLQMKALQQEHIKFCKQLQEFKEMGSATQISQEKLRTDLQEIEKDLAEKLKELSDIRQQKAAMESDLAKASRSLIAARSEHQSELSHLALELETTRQALQRANSATHTEKVTMESTITFLQSKLQSMKQQLDICQEVSAEEKSKLQEEMEALKQQLATVQLGAQQQRATSDSLMDSLQRKEEVLSEEKLQNVKLLEEMGRKDELIKTLNAQLQSAGICQEASAEEKSKLQEEMEALKQQLATVQLGAQQQKATSDSLMDSLQRKEDVLSEERQQNVKLLEEMGRKDELIKTLNDQLHSTRQEEEEEKVKLTKQLEGLQSSYDSVLELMKAKDLKLEAALSSDRDTEAMLKLTNGTVEQLRHNLVEIQAALDDSRNENTKMEALLKHLQTQLHDQVTCMQGTLREELHEKQHLSHKMDEDLAKLGQLCQKEPLALVACCDSKFNPQQGILQVASQEGAPHGQEGAPHGQEGAPRGQEGASHGQEGASHGQEGASHGQEGAPHGQEGASHGQEGAPRGQEGAPHGQEGAPHGQEGAPHGHKGVFQVAMSERGENGTLGGGGDEAGSLTPSKKSSNAYQLKLKIRQLAEKLRSSEEQRLTCEEQCHRSIRAKDYEVQGLQERVEKLQAKLQQRKRHTSEKLHTSLEKHSWERLALQLSLGNTKEELLSAQMQLEHEARWRSLVDHNHKQLIQEKAELQLRVLSMEESIRESSQKTVELESQLRRLAEENAILEEQNKAFALYQFRSPLTRSPAQLLNSISPPPHSAPN